MSREQGSPPCGDATDRDCRQTPTVALLGPQRCHGGGGSVSVQNARAPEADVASPCIDVCKMNAATGLCEGCRRTLEEIASWSVYSAAEKRAVLALLPARKAQA